MSGYGEGGLTGIGNGTWKTGGIFATKATAARPNGVLYLVVGRHQYGDTGAQDELAMGSHQTASAAFMIMSQDKGLTWQNHAGKTSADGAPPPESDPGRFNGLFATPEFVSYAPDGEPPTPAVDNSDAFIYAMSNRCMNGTMGCWNNGDALYLGRVHRDDIGDLDARKWQFYIGGDGDSDGAWGPDAAQAKAIFAEKDHVGQTSAQYVPALNRYVMLTWFYPDMAKRGEDFYDTSVFRVLEAPKPWGPWTVVRSVTMSPQGYYNPMFSEVRSAKGGLVSTVIMSGNWRGENTYRPWTMELRLNQSDEPPIDLAKSGVPAQGLVCFYDMAQRAGSTIPDRSGNHYDLASSAVWDAEGLSLLSDMKTFASVHLNDPLNDFTVFVLFRSPGPIRNSPYDRLLEYHFESGFSINRESNKPNTFGIDVFGADPPNNTPPYGLYSSTFTDGQAHLLVAERKHSEIALYDGVTRLASEGNVPVSPIAPGEFMFGPRGFSRSSATIIAAGLYRRALDDDEIQRLSSALRSLAVARGIEVH
jgi:hypothetical protein